MVESGTISRQGRRQGRRTSGPCPSPLRVVSVLMALAVVVPVVPAASRLTLVNDALILRGDAACGPGGSPAFVRGALPTSTQGGEIILPGRLIVALRSGAASAARVAGRDADGCALTGVAGIDAYGHTLGLREITAPFRAGDPSALPALRILKYAAPVDPREAAAWISRDPAVLWAEPDRLRVLEIVPSDLSYPAQWSLPKVEAPRAWDITTGDPGIVIAVIDSGLDRYHPDLSANVWTNAAEVSGLPSIDDDGNGFVDDFVGWDFVSEPWGTVHPADDPGPPDNDPLDGQGHGTMVAGVAAAVEGNAAYPGGGNVVGLCWGCRIMGLRAGYMLNDSQGTGVIQLSASIQALLYAADNGARIVNMSYSGPSPSLSEEAAINYARSRGLVLVAAAGNTADPNLQAEPVYPAAYPGVLGVAALDASDQKAWFSRYGPTVDLSAPGVGIVTTNRSAGLATVNGTSFSAPLVAAAAGLTLSQRPNLGPEDVEGLLEAGAEEIDAANPAFAGLLGAGRLSAFRALVAGRLGVENLVSDPQTPSLPYAITGIATDPNAPWLTFPTSFPITVDPNATVYLDPGLDLSLAACGDNAATVTVLSDDPAAPSASVEVRLRLDCDGDDDGYVCAARGGDDCDDDDRAVSPAADEVCDGPRACAGTGGIDDDCDGVVDEICSCSGRPSPPQIVSVAHLLGGGVRIDWRDLADNETGFKIFRRRGRSEWVRIGLVGAETLSFEDRTLRRRGVYTYGVKAYNRRGASARAVTGPVTVP